MVEESEVRIRFIADTQDVERKLAAIGPAGGGPPRMAKPPGAAPAGAGEDPPVAVKPSPSFMSIFKPLVALEMLKGMSRFLSDLVRQSTVLGAFITTWMKMLVALVDMVVMPFAPLLNLFGVFMSQMMGWLARSGILEKMADWVNTLVDYINNEEWRTALGHVVDGAIKALLWGLDLLWQGMKLFLDALWKELPAILGKAIVDMAKAFGKALIPTAVKKAIGEPSAGNILGAIMDPMGMLGGNVGGLLTKNLADLKNLFFGKHSPSLMEEAVASAIQGMGARGGGVAGSSLLGKSYNNTQNITFNVPFVEKLDPESVGSWLEDWDRNRGSEFLRTT